MLFGRGEGRLKRKMKFIRGLLRKTQKGMNIRKKSKK